MVKGCEVEGKIFFKICCVQGWTTRTIKGKSVILNYVKIVI